jgi:hypothetical protein
MIVIVIVNFDANVTKGRFTTKVKFDFLTTLFQYDSLILY